MSFIVKNEGGSSIPLLEEGVYTAICTGLVDLGEQENKMFNKVSRKVQIIWTIPDEKYKYTDKDNNEVEAMRQLLKEYSSNISEKSTLRKDLTSWRGKAFTEEELQGFDLLKLLLVPCQIQVIHQGKDKKYASVASIMGLPKGTKIATEGFEKLIFNFYDKETWNNYEKIPKFIQDKIKGGIGFEGSELDLYIKGLQFISEGDKAQANETDFSNLTDDDLPF